MTGSRFIQSVVDGSAQVFHFDKEYGLDQTSVSLFFCKATDGSLLLSSSSLMFDIQ